MRILFHSDCDASARENPFVVQLVVAVSKRTEKVNVQHGLFWLWLQNAASQFDIIHFQWPESIFGWIEPTEADLQHLHKTLERHKKSGARIVVTIHNEAPHGRDSDRFQQLYRIVYAAADGFVHLGDESKQLLMQRYGAEVAGKRHVTIVHGNYEWYPDTVEPNEARRSLNIPQGAKVFLAFGKIRSEEELTFLLRGFRRASIPDSILLIAGKIPSPSRRTLRYYRLRAPMFLNKRILLHEGFIHNSCIENYVKSADVVVIARLTNLNSGTAPLAFTFGRTVAGPDMGVIGELLQATGNPVYEARSEESLARALREGLAAAKDGQGLRNLAWAKTYMDWNAIATQHLDFYEELLRGKPSI